ncbi:hypothetical protein ACFLWN_01175 [Chloroflexota bacterium]
MFELDRLNERILRLSNEINEVSRNLTKIQNTSFVFILAREATQYKDALLRLHSTFEKSALDFPLYLGDSNSIQIGDKTITFRFPELSA